jgi:DNA-directed RNA polymerase specialized sigma24 family protein
MAGRKDTRRLPAEGLGSDAGAQLAWDALVERHGQQVWDAARRHGLEVAEAAEVCQLAWLRLADNHHEVAEGDVGEWLCAVAHSEALRVAWARQAVVAGTGNVRSLPSAVDAAGPRRAAARRTAPRPVA